MVTAMIRVHGLDAWVLKSVQGAGDRLLRCLGEFLLSSEDLLELPFDDGRVLEEAVGEDNGLGDSECLDCSHL